MCWSPSREKTWKPPKSVSMGSIPCREFGESAHRPDSLFAGAKVEVIRIAKNHLSAGRTDVYLRLVRARRRACLAAPTGLHESRRAHFSLRAGESQRAARAVRGVNPGI